MFENWIEREPRKTGRSVLNTIVKISFHRNKRIRNVIYNTVFIGEGVMKACDMKFGDSISIFSNPQNEKQFLIKKISSGKGYTLSRLGKKDESFSNFGRISFPSWIDEKKIPIKCYKTSTVHHEIHDDGILIKIMSF